MKKKIILLILIVCPLFTFSQYINYNFYEDFLNKYVSDEGYVDYDAIHENQEDFKILISRFEMLPVQENWSKNQQLAHWINVYNVYSMKLILDYFPISSIKDIADSFNYRFIPHKGQLLSLNYIEKEILSKTLDERIHFAINCASLSCPKLNRTPFYADTVENQLEMAAFDFINDASKNTITKKEIKISKIFDWFRVDFLKNNASIIDYINRYSKIKIKHNAALNYSEYNWGLNSQMKFKNKEFLASK